MTPLNGAWREKLGYPIFVKPANAGLSVGISKAAIGARCAAAVELALRHDTRVVFERFVDGHEVECAVSGNDEVARHPARRNFGQRRILHL